MDHRETPLIRGALWSRMKPCEKRRYKQHAVQWKANKAIPANRRGNKTRGVSLQMLQQAGMLGVDLEDENTSKFISDIAECQSDIVSFVQTLPELRNRVVQAHTALLAAREAGHLTAFGDESTLHLVNLFEGLISGLDVHAACPLLAPVHQEAPPPPGDSSLLLVSSMCLNLIS
jgi:hypothetical protein